MSNEERLAGLISKNKLPEGTQLSELPEKYKVKANLKYLPPEQ